MSEKMTTANSAEQGKVDIDFAECAVPKWSRRRFVTMFMIMLGFTFFSASMWVGQEMVLACRDAERCDGQQKHFEGFHSVSGVFLFVVNFFCRSAMIFARRS